MREVRAGAAVSLDASPADCLALVAQVDAYPCWHPDAVRRVEVLEHDSAGYPSRVRVSLRLGWGPLAGSFEEVMVVRVDPPAQVELERVPHEASDPERFRVTWRILEDSASRLEVELAAALEVPRVVPLGRLADSLAQGFVAAASRALAPPSPTASASSS